MSKHVYFVEFYERTRRVHVALLSLAQDRNRWDRVVKWAASELHPAQASAVADLAVFSPTYSCAQREISKQLREDGYCGLGDLGWGGEQTSAMYGHGILGRQ
eukprot:961130-Alexandrium_andersonii.AAC.1